jgi:hypothetical protein
MAAADPGDRPIRLIGISVSGLHEHAPDDQLGLFQDDCRRDAAARRVAEALDEVSNRFGSDALKRAKLIKEVRDMDEGEDL